MIERLSQRTPTTNSDAFVQKIKELQAVRDKIAGHFAGAQGSEKSQCFQCYSSVSAS